MTQLRLAWKRISFGYSVPLILTLIVIYTVNLYNPHYNHPVIKYDYIQLHSMQLNCYKIIVTIQKFVPPSPTLPPSLQTLHILPNAYIHTQKRTAWLRSVNKLDQRCVGQHEQRWPGQHEQCKILTCCYQNNTWTILLSGVSNIVGPKISFSFVSTISLSNSEATRLFMVVGTGQYVLIKEPCSLLLIHLFKLFTAVMTER